MILASTSSVRAEILRQHHIEFKQVESGFDEDSIICDKPKSFVWQTCIGKLLCACENLGQAGLARGIMAADSVVCVDGVMQRKAKNLKLAKDMLEFQSGKILYIFTAMGYKSHKGEFYDLSETSFKLKHFDKNDMQAYLDSMQWQGKAGCVMVEGFHKKYILFQKGLESSALGLSIEKFLPFLGII